MLEVKELRKEFKDVTAVDSISFCAEPGKIFGLLGPNGAGKTTTIRIILNIIKPTTGDVLFRGKSISSEMYDISGYLPEERGLYKKSTVGDTLEYFARMKSMTQTDAQKRITYWLERLEISSYRKKKVQELSKGNQQKVQFIGALLHNPDILILDEPFSGFDPINQQTVKEVILELVADGKIIILSTHQMDLAEKLCNTIFLIDQGKEVCSGTVQEVKHKFGTPIVKLGFSGDASFLSTHPAVQSVDLYQTFAEIQLAKSIQPAHFLKEIIQKIEVNQFTVEEPTLHKIFIDVIQKTKA